MELAAFIPLAMSVGGSILGAMGASEASDASIVMGQRQREAAQFKAQQLRSHALQTVAASQRAGDTEERQARLLQSRALAVAAASGGGASDPTVMNLISGIAGEGSYRRAIRLYEGEDRARTLRMQADAAVYEGDLAVEGAASQSQAYQTQGMSSLFKGGSSIVGSSLFQKYASGGARMPSASGDSNLIGGFDNLPIFG